AFEKRWAQDVVRAVLGTILFHRVVGGLQPTSLEVCGVTFSAPAAPDVEALIAARTDLICRALLEGVSTGANRRVKLFVTLYPTPLPALPPKNARSRKRSYTPGQRVPSPASAAAAQDASSSPSRGSGSRRASAAALAQAAPAAVTSALGWFSASARAAWVGGTQDDAVAAPANVPAGATLMGQDLLAAEQDAEIRMLDSLRDQGRKPFEGWMIEFEVLPEPVGVRGTQRPNGRDEKLRAQLNDFLLRTLDFTLTRSSHVPPITTTDLMPYGILVLVDPPTAPFDVPKPIIEPVKSFPDLHRSLASDSAGSAVPFDGRRAASVGGRR
ncbi:hypothetical protein BMF94_0136, partial [Rhodotorula taiwanensis]